MNLMHMVIKIFLFARTFPQIWQETLLELLEVETFEEARPVSVAVVGTAGTEGGAAAAGVETSRTRGADSAMQLEIEESLKIKVTEIEFTNFINHTCPWTRFMWFNRFFGLASVFLQNEHLLTESEAETLLLSSTVLSVRIP